MSTKRKSQLTLAQCISTKKLAIEVERSSQLMSDSEEESLDIEITPRTLESEESGASLPADGSTKCTAVCCSDFSNAYQPTNKKLYKIFVISSVISALNEDYPWLTVCQTKRKVFCLPYRYIFLNKLHIFNKNCSPAFIEDGFNNWRKATKKFHDHEDSLCHQESTMKLDAIKKPTLPQLFSDQVRQQQARRRKSLLTQLSCLRYLLRQGLAIRGHNDDHQGNLKQLLLMMSHVESDSTIVGWLQEKKCMSPDITVSLEDLAWQH